MAYAILMTRQINDVGKLISSPDPDQCIASKFNLSLTTVRKEQKIGQETGQKTAHINMSRS